QEGAVAERRLQGEEVVAGKRGGIAEGSLWVAGQADLVQPGEQFRGQGRSGAARRRQVAKGPVAALAVKTGKNLRIQGHEHLRPGRGAADRLRRRRQQLSDRIAVARVPGQVDVHVRRQVEVRRVSGGGDLRA